VQLGFSQDNEVLQLVVFAMEFCQAKKESLYPTVSGVCIYFAVTRITKVVDAE
jgi:hypothetical protein